jgi:hypothetical protein
MLTFQGVPIQPLTGGDWTYKLGMMTRLWHNDYGHSLLEVVNLCLPMPDYILTRKDGWSLGCYSKDLDEAFSLWPNDWDAIYIEADFESLP